MFGQYEFGDNILFIQHQLMIYRDLHPVICNYTGKRSEVWKKGVKVFNNLE